MKKNAVIFNDELGTMALGFSKAGYNICSIYLNATDNNSVQMCKTNWGNVVREINSDVGYIKEKN